MKSLVTTILAGCALALPHAAMAADPVKLTMNWTADSAHLGFAMAKAKGFYADEDLDVTLEEGRGSSVAAQLVATGRTEIGLADAGAALNVAAQGAPIEVIATIWKSGQFGVQYLADSGISTPADLKGKSVAVAPGTAMVPLFGAFLAANGMSESDVDIVNATQSAALGLLAKGDIDAIAETPENTVVPLEAEGLDVENMYFYNNGVPVVSLSLIARSDKVEQNADLYERFIRATLKGWQAAMEDPEAAVDALLAEFPETENTKDALLQGAKYSFASVCPGGAGDAIGVTDDDTWSEIYDVMTTAMGFSSDRPVTDYYTLDLLPAEPITCP
ncbi:ABC transporter substrate-binding protein [Acuticoccus sp. M5D2P5]|uniref:ABC transporter substrate-binding protein n=1 Tax=Acuticoccus kalidii TaxID=2910977 RepID=UPI001F1BCD1D|nr:ABC transporter substrate-binding protein [Acuticoccus kalidii]MCF3931989.1 ABC transporter substrate-binding protein [Acuticoccus kalidii]